MNKKAQTTDDLVLNHPSNNSGAMSVEAPQAEDAMGVQTLSDGNNPGQFLNPNVQTFVGPSTPRKHNEKPILEVTFTAFPREGELDGVDLLGKLTDMLKELGVLASNISIRKIKKKF